ncbi:MAG: peroxidase-related enzyme [Bacteroidales bacterium]
MNRINVIEPDDATGRLREIYEDTITKRGRLADVHKIQSLRPESIVKHMDLYMEIMFTKSELSRADREMMAVVVSGNNECEYCILHHGESLNHYWKDKERLALLVHDFRKAGLNEREISLCSFAETLTKFPGKYKDESSINFLKDIGMSDNAILDATLVISYFNFVNRIVLALGVETNEVEKQGYKF